VPLRSIHMSRSIAKKRYVLYYACGQKFCAGCGQSFPLERMTLDHRIPKSKGGTLAYSNIQLMCGPCNQRKADSMPEEVNA